MVVAVEEGGETALAFSLRERPLAPRGTTHERTHACGARICYRRRALQSPIGAQANRQSLSHENSRRATLSAPPAPQKKHATHSILYQRGVYPQESFQPRKHYGLSMMVTRDDALTRYLATVSKQMTGGSLPRFPVAAPPASPLLRSEPTPRPPPPQKKTKTQQQQNGSPAASSSASCSS